MLDNKRTKHTTPKAGVENGLSSSGAISGDDKKGRSEGDGHIPKHKHSSVKTKSGTFHVC